MTATHYANEITATSDELIAALQAEFALANRLAVEVRSTLRAAASAHLQACLLQHKLVELVMEREHWWHSELSAMTELEPVDDILRHH